MKSTEMLTKTLNPIVLIPARLAATRLPNKPLLDINGKPMIVRVYECARKADLGEVAVAAGDEAIVDAIRAVGGKAVLTDPALPSGSDRIFAALEMLDPEKRFNAVINLQGDLPEIDAATLRGTAKLLEDKSVDIGTAAIKIKDPAEIHKPNVVKIAIAGSRALYFSRSAIPHGEGDYFHHIGIYAYQRPALERFVKLPPSPLELREKLEQLRALEAGMRIDVAAVNSMPLTIDTPEDLENARRLIR